MTERTRRTGSETKAQAQRIAFELFTAQGIKATSLRQIAERLGISKASLYYHFASKDEIVRSLFSVRGDEAAELLDWARTEKPAPDLLERAVLRWVDSTSVDKLRGIRFVNANPAMVRGMDAGSAEIRDGLERLAQFLAGDDADPTRLLLVRMALLSINSAVMAAEGTSLSDVEIVAVAREAALAFVGVLRGSSV
ncbi:MAG TPA: helix-turn-helix domain-containing protein [Galbitalea sp.]